MNPDTLFVSISLIAIILASFISYAIGMRNGIKDGKREACRLYSKWGSKHVKLARFGRN